MMHPLRRACDLGPIGIIKRLSSKLCKKQFSLRWKRTVLTRKQTPINTFWHTDDTCQYTFPLHFYADLTPRSNHPMQLNNRQPDVRLVWEKSRLAHPTKQIILDWIQSNPFLLGVNWMCTMEVAIRAINLIRWFEAQDVATLEDRFLMVFFKSLKEHACYIKNNWETSDRPNNHYIADLVGYFYLCSILPAYKKHLSWTYKQILKQSNHQIQPDGTSYEGSTAYHKLDLELFLLFKQSCEQQNIALPLSFHEKLSQALLFLHNLAVSEERLQEGEFTKIGDDDGSTLGVVFNSMNSKDVVNHYPNFGLTIIKDANTHITFRHPTYLQHQPTGHFHQDALSVTLAINGIPVLVDPGSYLYTANPSWRNIMRSQESHNGPIINPYASTQKFSSHQDLFQLPLRIQHDTACITQNSCHISIQNNYQRCSRILTYNRSEETIEIVDTANPKDTPISWHFFFHPDITLKQQNPTSWFIQHNEKVILVMQSTVALEKKNGYYAPTYSVIQECDMLIASIKRSDAGKTEQRSSILQKPLPPGTHVFTFIKQQ